MSDRIAASAEQLASPALSAGEPWRVAVGGNRIQDMTVEQITQAFRSGELTQRTPLWPPQASGWQALGNFAEFQDPVASGARAAGSEESQPDSGRVASSPRRQDDVADFSDDESSPTRLKAGAARRGEAVPEASPYSEGDAAPTRLWLGGSKGQTMVGPTSSAMTFFSARPTQIPTRPKNAAPGVVPMPVALAMAQQHAAAARPILSEFPEFRPKRRGWLLVAGAVGLLSLGSAVFAARGDSRQASGRSQPAPLPVAELVAARTAASATSAPTPAGVPSQPARGTQPEGPQLARYEASPASRFASDTAASTDVAISTASERAVATLESKSRLHPSAPTRKLDDSKSSASQAVRAKTETMSPSSQPPPAVASPVDLTPEPVAAERVNDDAPPQDLETGAIPTSSSATVKVAASKALASAAALAASCRPRGGPAGHGEARVIYSPGGQVQSVEILTERFRDTMTASCVRMVFRRAKITAFVGEPATFITGFDIPKE
jgi:hypothetical protein